MEVAVSAGGRWSPVQKFPVLASPLVPELLGVHASNAVEVGLVDPKEAEAVHLPVAWRGWGALQTPGPATPSSGGLSGSLQCVGHNLGGLCMTWVLEKVPRGQAWPWGYWGEDLRSWALWGS